MDRELEGFVIIRQFIANLLVEQLLNVPVRKLHTSDCQKKIERFTKDLRSQLSYSVMAASSHHEKMRYGFDVPNT